VNIIETIKDFLSPSSPALRTVTINGPVDYAELPQGFFNVIGQSGKISRGYNGCFLSWNVGEIVVDGGRRIPSPPMSELPTVRLNFQRPAQDGAQCVGGHSIIDTDSLEADTAVVWDGSQVRDGVEWV